ncbi:chemotaxis protein [Helicobacter sp. 11S02629-2]|uniref:chemotaxis protein n=1 Tax=Helicobacter sp. 11S02629-2 TaxID=1476195 RepID=UPI000BA4F5B8|nr:chemotaxis protein [Helicobacter sp. 11S02629-2]PAF45625.1 chemotaxis protein [Helicobacter sp. 11S02629-2]
MTQEELDSLMSQGVDDLENLDSQTSQTASQDEHTTSEEMEPISHDEDIKAEYIDPARYRADAGRKWPPPPPTEEHKVVHQLDDVTKDSEVKMTEIFDQLEVISSAATNIEKQSKALKKYFSAQEELFETLSARFPNIETFKKALEDTKEIAKKNANLADSAMECGDASMQAMDIMQYQDIHRQKIERVINVMRALSQYMNSLFEGRVEDSRRVGSATYIAGDRSDEVATEDDIEALIASFGNK